MVSTKLLRLPTRGALGNGLRVVAGSVLASDGFLVVITRNRRIELTPRARRLDHGRQREAGQVPGRHPDRDRLRPGDPGGRERAVLGDRRRSRWRTGRPTRASSSPCWYDAPQFHELLSASGDRAGARAGGQPRRLHRRRGLARSLPRPDWAAWPASDVSREQAEQPAGGRAEQRASRSSRSGSARSVPNCSRLRLCHVERRQRRSAPSRPPRSRSWSRRGPESARTCGCWSASTARRSPATSTRRATSATSTCSAAGFTTPSPKRRRTSTSPSGSTS